MMCLSNPQYTSDVEGQLRKQLGKINPVNRIWTILMTLTLLHQKAALLYEISYRTNLELSKRISLDIYYHQEFKINIKLCLNEALSLKVLNNTNNREEIIIFDSDSIHLYKDSCVNRRIAGFKDNFKEGTYTEIE